MNQSIIEQLEQNVKNLYKSMDTIIKKLKEEEPKEEEAKEESWPKVGDKYFTKTSGRYIWVSDSLDLFNERAGNCFRTEEEANMALLRDKAGAKRWFPGLDEDYYYWNFVDGVVEPVSYFDNTMDLALYFMGNCHKTGQEAEAWGKKYGKAFRLPVDDEEGLEDEDRLRNTFRD